MTIEEQSPVSSLQSPDADDEATVADALDPADDVAVDAVEASEVAAEEPADAVSEEGESEAQVDVDPTADEYESEAAVAVESDAAADAQPDAVAAAEAEAIERAASVAASTSNGEPTDGEPAEADEAEPVMPPSSPYDLPGSWYVVHSYSGYENKVRANLTTRISSMHMEDSIFDIVIPMEDVVEIKSGRKVTVPRKQFPGYVLVRMYLDDESWSVVRNTPGVTGFVGSGTKPTPLSRREVERILGVRKDEEKKTPRFKPDWEVSETVRVIDGPFADFNGVIEDINVDQSKVRVLVDIFGRETPVELNFEQIQKF